MFPRSLAIVVITTTALRANASSLTEPGSAEIAAPPGAALPPGPPELAAPAPDVPAPVAAAPAWSAKHTLLVAGAGTWLLPFAPIFVVGVQSAFAHPSAPESALVVPVAGPWLYLGRGGASNQPTNQALLALNGCVQLAGAAVLAIGTAMILHEISLEHRGSALTSAASDLALHLVPTLSPTQAGVAVGIRL